VLDKMLEEKDIEEKLVGSERYFRELAEKQDKLERDLDIDEYHRALFSAMREATFLLDHKKEIFTQIHFHCAKLLEEIGKRLGIAKELTQYYWPEELETALVRGESLSKLKLTRRYKRCLAYWHNSVCLLKSGIAAEKFLQLHIKPEGISPTVIDGIIASAGRYEGRVKVVLTAVEIAKVERGDILVAPMTSPDYVPAMRRAGAIITDEGGVMCHAAIVSRELGVPCVVGTKNATEILHDGDIVEVNANHNSVRIVKK